MSHWVSSGSSKAAARQGGPCAVLHDLIQLFLFCTGLRMRQNGSRDDFADRASQGVQR